MSEPITGWGRPSLGDDLRLRLLYFGASVIDESWSGRYVSEPIWRLYRNAHDGATIEADGRRFALRAGAVWLVPPWLRWTSACRGRVGHVNAHVEVPQWPRELVRSAFPRPLEVGHAVDGDALHALAVELARDGASAARFWRVVGLCAAALAHACDAAPARLRTALLPDADEPLAALRAQLDHALDRPLGRRELAAALGVSEATLVRRLRSTYGTTPGRWVAERRAARAAELLTTSDLPIEAIAARCGFADRHAFSRAFARATGSGPAAYRRARRPG